LPVWLDLLAVTLLLTAVEQHHTPACIVQISADVDDDFDLFD
jgi:hypothetical protein